MEDGAIYALAGTTCLIRVLIAWIKAGADPQKAPKDEGINWGILVIDAEGARHYSRACPYPEEQEYPFTTGTGRDIALGALKAGATPKEAVEIACRVDVHSGGSIQVVNIAEALGLQPVREAAE